MSHDHHQSAQIRSEPVPPCSYTTMVYLGFIEGGHRVKGSGDGSPTVGSRGKAPVMSLGDEIPES